VDITEGGQMLLLSGGQEKVFNTVKTAAVSVMKFVWKEWDNNLKKWQISL